MSPTKHAFECYREHGLPLLDMRHAEANGVSDERRRAQSVGASSECSTSDSFAHTMHDAFKDRVPLDSPVDTRVLEAVKLHASAGFAPPALEAEETPAITGPFSCSAPVFCPSYKTSSSAWIPNADAPAFNPTPSMPCEHPGVWPEMPPPIPSHCIPLPLVEKVQLFLTPGCHTHQADMLKASCDERCADGELTRVSNRYDTFNKGRVMTEWHQTGDNSGITQEEVQQIDETVSRMKHAMVEAHVHDVDARVALAKQAMLRNLQKQRSREAAPCARHGSKSKHKGIAVSKQGLNVPPASQAPRSKAVSPQAPTRARFDSATFRSMLSEEHQLPKPVEAKYVPSSRVSKADMDTLLKAVQSLYHDRLEPLVMIVGRRVEENVGVRWMQDRLKVVAQATPGIMLKSNGPRRAEVLHLQTPLKPGEVVDKHFVEHDSLEDVYPEDLWESITNFVMGDDWQGQEPKGCSYDLAKSLRQSLPALQRYKFGEVYHMVHLAVKKHKIFGYRDGRLVPYKQSLDYEKKVNARTLQPTGAEYTDDYVASWQEATQMISELVGDLDAKNGITLSALRSRFHQRFARHLSETSLGYTKLSDLLRDPRMRAVCILEKCGNEHYLLRPPATSGPSATHPPLPPPGLQADKFFANDSPVIHCNPSLPRHVMTRACAEEASMVLQ
eukprot:gnl/TRDRNA2_/TRDRNA2_127967_c0_seq1.p1 gnl/TRDRNA2_/TRDRNA2_127967_c0~~gnl/TRDRNA2_/TRDRNA2_127967_c0_seq1.p1  ORF type:complete len:670 (+),score=120.77 gnl/TRDRNA2_/TRDRNA2_127967_c0_seq1:62-2071(+)